MIGSVVLALLAQTATLTAGEVTKLRPDGSPAAWVTNDDYPEAAWQAGIQGVVSFRLSVNQLGAVEGCQILASSGSVILDTETCRLLTLRARFIPARNEKNEPMSASYFGRFRWTIPQSDQRELPFVGSVAVPYVDILRVVIDANGRVEACELVQPSNLPAGTGPCASILASKPVKPFVNAEGKPVRKTVIIRREVELRDE